MQPQLLKHKSIFVEKCNRCLTTFFHICTIQEIQKRRPKIPKSLKKKKIIGKILKYFLTSLLKIQCTQAKNNTQLKITVIMRYVCLSIAIFRD